MADWLIGCLLTCCQLLVVWLVGLLAVWVVIGAGQADKTATA